MQSILPELATAPFCFTGNCELRLLLLLLLPQTSCHIHLLHASSSCTRKQTRMIHRTTRLHLPLLSQTSGHIFYLFTSCEKHRQQEKKRLSSFFFFFLKEIHKSDKN
jgi:hypothetical protein